MTTNASSGSSARIPSVGAGFWKVDRPEAAEVARAAIAAGYRHLDCACDYGNEAEVGGGIAAALAEGLCAREDLWVTSKLWNTYHSPEHVRAACERSLSDLGLEQLDLYLVHFPISQRFVPFAERYPPGWFFDPEAAEPTVEFSPVPMHETWAAMEALVEAGLTKHIGISNFGTAMIADLLSYATIRPAVLQVESHPYLTQDVLVRYCQEQEIAVTAFSPLGAQSYHAIGMADAGENLLDDAPVLAAADAHGKTPAQVLLRWGVQRGTSVIPKTRTPARLVENLDIFDFELSAEEMAALGALNRDRRYNDPADFGERAFNTFMSIYD